MTKRKKKVANSSESTTLESSPSGPSPEQVASAQEDKEGPGAAHTALFIGVDGAARKAGVAFIVLSEDGDSLATLPIDTQSVNFYNHLFHAVRDLKAQFPTLNEVYVTCEVPPPGKFAHKIGQAVNFASGKIVGVIGCCMLAAGLPFPAGHVTCLPNQWRKALMGHKGKGYTKDVSRSFVRKHLSKNVADERTDDEVEALCVAFYGIQQVYPDAQYVIQALAGGNEGEHGSD